MKFLFTPFLRRYYLFLALLGLGFFSVQLARHSAWHKQRLYQQLLRGNPEQQLDAAASLATYNGEKQLLAALQSPSDEVRALAVRGLNFIWFHAAGSDAYKLVEAAYQAAEKKNFTAALALADRLVTQYPNFAEAWNRRGSIHWQMGAHEKSLTDCAKALEILKKQVQPHIKCRDVTGDDRIAKVSLVGLGMRSHSGIAATMFRTLAEEGINIQMISTSEIKISVVIDEKYAELAVRVLHKAFELEQG